MLDNFRAILDGDDPPPPGARAPSEDELIRALQVVLKAQIVYADTPGIGRSYELARHYAPFFASYFACLGYAFTVSHRDQMVALTVPEEGARHDAAGERLRKDETLVLLSLRVVYEEGLTQGRTTSAGMVEATTDDLVETLRTSARVEPPDETRLIEILRQLSRRGALRLGERDRAERVTPLAILPGIAVLASDRWLEQVRCWSTAGHADAPHIDED